MGFLQYLLIVPHHQVNIAKKTSFSTLPQVLWGLSIHNNVYSNRHYLT